RWLRWLVRGVLGLLLLVVLVVVGVLVYVQTPGGSDRVLAFGLRAANEALAGKLRAGSLEVHGGHIVLRDVTLETPEGERVAHVDLLEVRARLLPLIRKTVQLSVVRIEHPELWLTVDEDGMNLTRAIAARNPKPPEPSSGPLPFTFVVDSFALDDGAVRLVQGKGEEARQVALTGLGLRAGGRYAGPTSAFEGRLEGRAAVSGTVKGPLQLSVRGAGDPKALEAAVDLGLAGLVLKATGSTKGSVLQARLERLVVPPAVGRALSPAWTPSVPVELSGEGGLDGDAARADLRGRAGSAELALRARGDVKASRVDQGHLELRHVNLAQLLTDGPASDLALTADVRGGGKSLETLTGAVDLSVPPSQVRNAKVGPVELHATADRGTFDVRELRAILPGLRVQGRGKGTPRAMQASLDAEATDLALLGRTFGSLSASRFPPLAGSGTLHVEATGPMRHPGVGVEGNFPSLRVSDIRARSLVVSAHVADIDRVLDSNARVSAQELRLGERTLKPVSLSFLTRGRALDLHAGIGGTLPLELHLGGTADEDRRGLQMEAFALRYPEASWTLEAPTHLRFAADDLSLEPMRLVAEDQTQAIRLGGWKRGNRVDASVGLQALDLGKLPRALLPPSLSLAGRVTLDARARGPLSDPAVEATVDANDVTAGKVQHLFLKGNGSWVARRAKAQLQARGLGTELSADVDLPVDAFRRRRHEPVKARIGMPAFDLGQVICTAVRMKLITRGCEADKPEVSGSAELNVDLSGYADAPVLQASARTQGVRYRKLPPTDLTVTVDGPEKGNLSVSAKGTALQGTVDVQASVGRSLARLVSDARPAETLRTAALQARARIAGLQLKPLREAELIPRDVSGAVSLSADLQGTVSAPSGELTVQGQQLQTPPMDPTDVSLKVEAQKAITAVLEAKDAHGALANVKLDVSTSPASLQARKTFDDVPVKLDGKFGPLDLSRLPVVVGEGRLARRLRGTLEATVQGAGSLQAPTLVAEARTAQLGAGDTPLGKAEVKLDYRQARSQLHAALESVNGGALTLEARADLDLSFPAVRRGLKPSSAPIQATLTAQKFDLAFLTGFTTTLRKVAGTLDIDARASGTVAAPQAQGKLEWKDGLLGLSGFGEYRRVHLLVNASNDRVSLDDLEAHTDSGTLKLTALGTRDGPLWTVKANGETKDFPIFTDDQLVATLSLRTNLDGTARKGHIELDKVHIPEAHVELPTQTRRDLQSLNRPDDIILLKNGKPVDPKRARKVLARDREAEVALGLGGPVPEEARPTKVVVVLDATKNLWIKGQDLNVEVGLSPDFRVEIGEETDLFGEVRIIRGRLDVIGRRFDFQKNSVVRFTGPPTEPGLNVTAVYNNVKAGVKVSMNVQGQAGEIQLVPTSEPPLTESEIYTLLATGRTNLKRGSGGSEIGSTQAVSVLGSLAASQLKTAVSDKVGLDVLSIEAGDEGLLQGSTLEAGKYVTDDLYVGYAGKVGADPTKYENSNAVRLEYQFLPRWSFEATYGDAKSGSADIVWTRDY
ncbi:MAG TPA: translocation/assembly module TamB domain-containing protein, partial [Myxococcaceae bacterium]|nr:translocation/assembly module TamB domain-containing protein [Myxococcaceae bacterium]